MKKALALSAFALILTLPLVSSAGTVTSTFVGSTSGTTSIGIGDTITFEISITTDANLNINSFSMSLGGDEAAAQGSSSPVWAGVQGVVSAWSWNFRSTGSKNTVKFATNGLITPQAFLSEGALQIRNGYAGVANLTGNGNTNIIGTVTITSNGVGNFTGGGFKVLGLDAFFGSTGDLGYISNTVAYTVVPEPGTALLMVLGLGGLGVMGRKSRK